MQMIALEKSQDLESRGYLLCRNFFTQAQIHGLVKAVETGFSRRHLTRPVGTRLYVILNIKALLPFLAGLIEETGLEDRVAEILREDLTLLGSRLVIKPAGCPENIFWHRDADYGYQKWDDGITAWFPLVKTHTDNGCLWYRPGSHRENPGHETADTPPAVSIPMQPGDLALHTSGLLHRSGVNSSSADRPAIMLEWVRRSARHIHTGEPLTGEAS
ncbi:MAG: phytanoyl-CoA dioxygenase family protein [Acidobacteriota bacterium]|nr:phytanoyl-CoA dioxygenase family protein [Acidobacteriota bacterium]